MARTTPYSNFNFLISMDLPNAPNTPLGGFSDVSGLGTEITIAEYRNGNEPENHVRKIAGLHKVSDVTLKRGVVKSDDLWQWVEEVRTNPEAKREVVITMQDEAKKDVQTWTLHGAIPQKYTAPTFAAKGGSDVAMEELVLAAEGIDFAVAGG